MVSPDGPVRSFIIPMLPATQSTYKPSCLKSTCIFVSMNLRSLKMLHSDFSCCPANLISHTAAHDAEGAMQLPDRLRNSYAAELAESSGLRLSET